MTGPRPILLAGQKIHYRAGLAVVIIRISRAHYTVS